jgi:hypothetical protein
VSDGPVLTLTKHEPTPAHEFQNVVTRLEDLTLEALPAAHEVPYPFVVFGRDVDQDQAIIAEVARDLDGVASVGLSVLARAAWNE